MAASLRKMGVYLGLVEDEDGYADSYADDGYDEPETRRGAPINRSADRGAERYDSYDRGYDAPARTEGPGRAVREWAPDSGGYDQPADYDYVEAAEAPASYRITTLHPRTYNEAVTIGEHFRSGTPVIMNLSEMADTDAKRLVDFAAGLTFGLHGRVERVTAKVFLLSPQNVTVTAQDKARMAENGFFNQS